MFMVNAGAVILEVRDAARQNLCVTGELVDSRPSIIFVAYFGFVCCGFGALCAGINQRTTFSMV